jgi:hypothetical protein
MPEFDRVSLIVFHDFLAATQAIKSWLLRAWFVPNGIVRFGFPDWNSTRTS